MNLTVGAALWLTHAFVVWPQRDAVVLVLAAAVLSVAFNAAVSLIFAPHLGFIATESVRTTTNVVIVVVLARHTGWPPVVWAWMLFNSIALPPSTVRFYLAQLLAWMVPMGVVGILDGVSPAVPLTAAVMSTYLVIAARQTYGHTDRTLNQHEVKLASIIEHIGEGIVSVDRELRIITVSGSFREFVRWRRGDEIAAGGALFEEPLDEVSRGWRERFQQVLRGEHVPRGEHRYTRGGETRIYESALHPIRDREAIVGATLVNRDVTARHAMEERAEALHKQLLEISRKAGMAEVASSVLHNVGNVLNSINVSASVLADHVRGADTGALLARLSALLGEHAADLPGFFARDPRGKLVPELVAKLAAASEADRERIAAELQGLRKNVEHIKAVVSVQQSQAKAGGTVERVDLAAVLDDAIGVGASSDARNGVEVVRAYGDVPPLLVDRHKLLQILMNLFANARHAVRHNGRDDHHIEVRLARQGDEVIIAVEDNGYGIAAENLPRIFTHGFTTKAEGHGFGLHSSAAAAADLGGSLGVTSEPGRGACFTLRLPLREAGAAAA